jgi:hypothetical protein
MTAPNAFTPYSTLKPMFPSAMPSWIPDDLDKERIESYRIYEQIYWNVPDTYKLTWRGTEDKPIYVPSGMTIVDTLSRYTATDMQAVLQPIAGTTPSPDAFAMQQQYWTDFFAREEFYIRFQGNKKFGLIRGDAIWHIVGDPDKPEGSRISLYPIDPGMYFPIYNVDDVDKIDGAHIVDQYIPPGEEDLVIKRTTYRKPGTADNPGQWVTVEIGQYALDDWEGPKAKPKKIIRPVMELPGITSLPLYHIKNSFEPGNPFGSSELRGVERLMAAVNQAISDEELTLALEGIGLYATDANPPVDDDGNKVNWRLGPGKVVETQQGRKFDRVSGVSSVAPWLDHVTWLMGRIKESKATPDIAIGNVDVSIAQSGIALALQYAPTLAKTAEKDQLIVGKMSQLFYDLATQWFPVYERVTFEGIRVIPVVGDKLPIDRAARLAELNDMLDRKVISRRYYRQEAAKLGYVFGDEDMQAEVEGEEATLAVASDPFAARVGSEIDPNEEDQNGA